MECLKHLLKMNPIDQGDRRNYQYRKLFMDDLTVKELLADECKPKVRVILSCNSYFLNFSAKS